MVTEVDPIIGNWYQHLDKGQRFCVVAVDEESGLIEIQHFDGDLEEIERAIWYQINVEPSEEPENWAGALDVGELDDLGTSVTDTDPGDWSAPLVEISAQDRDKPKAEEEEPVDDWGEGVGQEELLEDQ
jgi:hypothetical protein